MSNRNPIHPAQLGFDGLLTDAEADNRLRRMTRRCANLPDDIEQALPFYRDLIARHHAAMLAGNSEQVFALREQAHRLAEKLNNYEPGILAGDDAPGCVLDRETRAPDGTVPLWGQSGSFEITACERMRVRIVMLGMFGIGACFMAWPGFGAHAVAYDEPFLSETGYRSFLGIAAALEPDHTPDSFARAIVEAHVRRELKGRLVAIEPKYRPVDQTEAGS